jgi:hypothetical protein
MAHATKTLEIEIRGMEGIHVVRITGRTLGRFKVIKKQN